MLAFILPDSNDFKYQTSNGLLYLQKNKHETPPPISKNSIRPGHHSYGGHDLCKRGLG